MLSIYLSRMHKFHILLLPLLSLLTACDAHNHDDHDEDDDHHEALGVHLEPEQAARFGVMIDTVTPGKFHDVVRAAGIIEPSNSDIFTATAKRSGIITLAPGINPGVALKTGEKIATVTVEGVQGGDLNKAAAANLRAAKAEYERLKPLFEEKLVSASTFREAERAYHEAEALAAKGSDNGGNASILAPGAGILQALYVKSGDYVETGAPVALIGKNATQILKVELPVREIRHIPEIVSANFSFPATEEVMKLEDLDGKKISGPNPGHNVNGYVPVYFSFNGVAFVSAGGYVDVYLLCEERHNVITVPKDALVEIQGNKYVYVALDDHNYDKRLVKTGSTDGERVEITEGLREGDPVVAKGASIVRMAEVSAVAPPAHTHNH